MKIEIGKEFPGYFKSLYPEEFQLFSHFETTAAVPGALFAITTWKENGKPNVCLHSWSCFHGDKTAFFAVMGNLYQHTHTYANILREKCFCVNFLPISCYGRLTETIFHNDYDSDEFQTGDFILEEARTIHAPVIREAFFDYGVHSAGRPGLKRRRHGRHGHRRGTAHVRGGGLCPGLCERYGKEGFMMLVPSPREPCHRGAGSVGHRDGED